MNCETVDTFPTLEDMGDIDTKGTPMATTMTMKDDDDKRLTPAQRRMRDEAADIPKRYRRSVDAYRRACGFTPLWGSSLERERKRR